MEDSVFLEVWFPANSLEEAGIFGRDELEDPLDEALRDGNLGEVTGGGGGMYGSNIDVTIRHEHVFDQALALINRVLREEGAPDATVVTRHAPQRIDYKLDGSSHNYRDALLSEKRTTWKYDLSFFSRHSSKRSDRNEALKLITNVATAWAEERGFRFWGKVVADTLGTSYFLARLDTQANDRSITFLEAETLFNILRVRCQDRGWELLGEVGEFTNDDLAELDSINQD